MFLNIAHDICKANITERPLGLEVLSTSIRVHSVAHSVCVYFVNESYLFIRFAIVLSDDLGCLLLVYQEIFSVFGFQGSK